jgi:DNA-directed RNA polymerase subunit RPC12/RpoP
LAQEIAHADNGIVIACGAGMDDDNIEVNCGRCGRPIVVRLEAIREARTVECNDCVNRMREAPVPSWRYNHPVRFPRH